MDRCGWCLGYDKMEKYHDEEWGTPLHDDRAQFEFLSLEVMQCGLNWTMMIKKREIFRECFDGFDFEKIARYGERDIERIMSAEGMIKSRRKIAAIINNAQRFLEVRREFGTFSDWLWSFTGGKTVCYIGHGKENAAPVARNGLSDDISRELKRRGFKFLGSVTVYSHLQACGIINDHSERCFRYREIVENFPTVRKRRDREA